MNKKRGIFDILRGLGLWAMIGTVIYMAVRLQLFFPRSVIEWLGESPNPQQALIAFSAAVSSVLMGLLRLGIEVPPLKPFAAAEAFREYVTGVPLWALSFIIVISVYVLFVALPVCQPPTVVNFKVQGREETYRPNDILIASTDDFLAVTAEPFESDTVLSCRWQYIGDAFETVGSSTGCETIVKLSGEPGNGLITLQAAQDFCNKSSVFSLNVQVTGP